MGVGMCHLHFGLLVHRMLYGMTEPHLEFVLLKFVRPCFSLARDVILDHFVYRQLTRG